MEKLKLSGASNDPSRLWKKVKIWSTYKWLHNGLIVNSETNIASTMNSFFLGKVTRLRDKIPESEEDPLAKLREAMSSR